MKLTYYDNFAFACKTKKGVFTVNPQQKDASLLFSLFTGRDRDQSLNGNLLSWPGEYEFGKVAIRLFELTNGNLGAKFLTEHVRMVFLPALEKELTEEEHEICGNVDILVMEIKEATSALKKMVEEIDPKVVIPTGPGREKFLADMGAGNAESVTEFDFEASSLPIDQTIFIKLQTA